ncbi:MAG: helix-turn-helix domain-containing protein [Caldilinea sp. CFX5]|nr:helix-turn-helix domain-containing protein [Caldilinea sp. CFX5]
MTPLTTFGAFLRQVRKRAGMTQGDLAAAVGYSVSFVCDLEQNRRLPTVAVVLQQFIPALGLQDEATLSARLVELAALARGEQPPATLTVQRTTHLVVSETFVLPSSHLPAPPSELIGREQAIKTLCNRLQGHSGRLLTLTGPPGVGKTRLALAVAGQLEALFKDGARFVPLAAISDPELVATTIANALKLLDTGKQSPQERLIQGLRRQELLLVLDNFEQIVAAAPLLATVLAECPRLSLLVTSRERLHLRAEQRFPVQPLDLAFAVALFVQRAQMVDPSFDLTSENHPTLEKLCQRLDCLPLAIELIAARIDLFAPHQMLTRLRGHGLDLLTHSAQDAPEHQRTLRHAIQTSYALLTEGERVLFRTLGVFVDGFDLAAVTYFGFDAETLQGLVSKSLVQVTASLVIASGGEVERRFLLLEMMREYAREQLQAHAADTAAQQHHASYYLQVVERVEPKLWEAQAAKWLAYLDTEHNNIRSALTWTLATGDMTTALRLCGALGFFWDRRGHLHEGKLWIERALAAGANAPPLVRAKALSANGLMEHILGNHPQAQRLVEESLTIYQTLNDQRNVAEKSMQLGGIFRKQHLYAQAQFFYEQSFKLFDLLGDPARMAAVRSGLGNLAMNQGDYVQASMHYELGMAGYRASGNKLWIAEVLPNMARLALLKGEYQRAFAYCEEMLALTQELGDQEGVMQALNQLGSIMLRQGQMERAAHYLTQSLKLAQALDYPPRTASVLTLQGDLAFAQADFVRAGQSYRQSLQIAHQLLDRVEIANELANLARVAHAGDDEASAIRLLGAAASLRAMLPVSLPLHERSSYEQLTAAARAHLDETTYTRAYAEGYAMTIDQAVAFALGQFDRPQQAIAYHHCANSTQ